MNKFSASLNTTAFVNWPNGAFDEDLKEGDEDRYKTIGSEITMGPLMKITKAKMIIIKGIVLLIWN